MNEGMTGSLSLSDFEQSIIADKDFLLTKRNIMQKVTDFFSRLSMVYQHKFIQLGLAEEPGAPKISKGENYKGLPYVMLDFPRIFRRNEIFAIRTFFWWGNFFSITLHVSGSFKAKYFNEIVHYFTARNCEGWYINVTNDEWEHEVDSNYYEIINADLLDRSRELTFVKIVKKIPLPEWDNGTEIFISEFEFLLNALQNQAPIR